MERKGALRSAHRVMLSEAVEVTVLRPAGQRPIRTISITWQEFQDMMAYAINKSTSRLMNKRGQTAVH